MVDINLTTFVQLILFLVFLWGTGRFIMRPILNVIDEREESLETIQVRTQADSSEANRLENEYSSSVQNARVESEERFRSRRHTTYHEHQVFIDEERAKGDAAVAETRKAAQQAVDDARPEVLLAAPELSKILAAKLRGGGAAHG